MKNNILYAVVLLMVLTGCEQVQKTESIKLVTATTYPELPDIEPLSDPGLLPWKHNMPRDMEVMSVINNTACRKVKTKINERIPYVVEPVEEQTKTWWKKCGEHPIFPETNIHVGFDLENWNIVLSNLFKLKERNWQYKQRVLEINNQRETWRNQAERERIKIPIEPPKKEEPKEEKSFFKSLFSDD